MKLTPEPARSRKPPRGENPLGDCTHSIQPTADIVPGVLRPSTRINTINSMSFRPTTPLDHPIMLDDLTMNLQRMSARLPPDTWDAPSPVLRVERRRSGALLLSPIDSTFDVRSSVRVPSPLDRTTATSMEECGDEIELLPPPMPRGKDVSAGAEKTRSKRKAGPWFWKWFYCFGLRK